MMKMLKALFIVALGAGAFAGGSLVFRHSSPPPVARMAGGSYVAQDVVTTPLTTSDLVGQLEARNGMDMSRAADLGTFGSGASAVHLVTAPTAGGGNCLLSDSAATGPASSCLTGSDLFAQNKVVYLVESDGGPNPAQLNYLRVVGLAAPSVDALQVVLTSGARSVVAINDAHAFDYEAPLATLHSGDVPTTLVAYSGGAEVGTFPLTQ